MTVSDRRAVAVVGTSFGCRVHVAAFRSAGWDVPVLVGRHPDRTARRAERLGIPHAVTSLEQALAIEGVVAVSLATPPATHHSLVLEALAAGRHVLCEKPFALNAPEARQMAAAASEAGLVGAVGHEFRFAEDRATAWRAIRSGSIGEPRLGLFVSWGSLVANADAAVPEWWWNPHQGGGWLAASGSHLVDQVRWWLGEVASVSASLDVVSDGSRPAEDSFTIRLRLDGGASCVLQQTAAAWGPGASETRVAGSVGSVWLHDGEAWLADRAGARRLPIPSDLRLAAAPPASADPRHRFTHLELGPYQRLVRSFGEAIVGDPVPPGQPRAASFADGVATMEVLDAIRLSAANDGAVVVLG